MKLAVIGATGLIGTRVVPEALDRGHEVTAISRNPEAKYDPEPNLELTSANVLYLDELTEAVDGHDAVVSTFAGPYMSTAEQNGYGIYMEGARDIKLATRQTESTPLVFVGGAGSLHVEDGHQLVDDPEFPYEYLVNAPDRHLEYLAERTGFPSKEAFLELVEEMREGGYPENPNSYIVACRTAFDLYENDETFDWSFLSPPWYLRPGEQTGSYESQVDDLPVDDDGESLGISVADLAVAILDEVEEPNYNHEHWTAYSYEGY